MRIAISVRIWSGSTRAAGSFSNDATGDAEASNLMPPKRCRPSFRAPEMAVTRTASSANEFSWPSSRSMMAACKLAIEPQKRDTPSWRQRKPRDLHVLECISDARSSSTRRVNGVGVHPRRDGVGWNARPSTSFEPRHNVSRTPSGSGILYLPRGGNRPVSPSALYSIRPRPASPVTQALSNY